MVRETSRQRCRHDEEVVKLAGIAFCAFDLVDLYSNEIADKLVPPALGGKFGIDITAGKSRRDLQVVRRGK